MLEIEEKRESYKAEENAVTSDKRCWTMTNADIDRWTDGSEDCEREEQGTQESGNQVE